MSAYADTGFLVSLYLIEGTTPVAQSSVAGLTSSLPLLPLGLLELRNAFNFAVNRKRITLVDREVIWQKIEGEIVSGFYDLKDIAPSILHAKARELSDRYTPSIATRSLDLLHVAAALLLGASEFLSFDKKQRQAAKAEGLKVLPII